MRALRCRTVRSVAAGLAGDRDVEGHASLDLVVTGQEALQGIAEALRFDRGQVAQVAQVDAEHRNARRADQVHGPQHGAVATKADGQVEATRSFAVSGSAAAGPVRLEQLRSVPLLAQPAAPSRRPARGRPRADCGRRSR